MKAKLIAIAASVSILLLLIANAQKGEQTKSFESANDFSKYWYDGKAELSSYTLVQNRYGQLHEGKAVLVYVTEDFSKSKQVKLDDPNNTGKDKLPILKLNFTKNFLTGIYPYSIINSVFTPVDLSGTVKTSCSVQEWCGHTFTQLNRIKDGFSATEYSYFETEGDKKNKLPEAILEDELWNIIRINPGKLPEGKISLIRGNVAVRLMHVPLTLVEANITKSTSKLEGKDAVVLTVEYPERTLKIYYTRLFPHTVLGWDETYSEFGKKANTTKARLIKTMRQPYWLLHNNEHRVYRDSLGL
ncbi:MAG: hypothetical protein HZB42_07965 [Sphingobacteriales bacterium]|nr:hypothetical protein [Sphingobacteriales bacterium]